MPGDSPRFDLYDGLREFLISAKRKEIHNERVSEPESYEMGLQISRGVYTEYKWGQENINGVRLDILSATKCRGLVLY